MSRPIVSLRLATNSEIAVIVPTIRVDDWLNEAVESLLRQKTTRRFTIVVAFDGVIPPNPSPWEDRPEVEFVHSPTRLGLPGILAFTIARVDAELIARLDADDVAADNRLELQAAAFSREPDLVLLGTTALEIDEKGFPIGRRDAYSGVGLGQLLVSRNVLIHSSVMFRKSTYSTVGGYNPTLRQMEDYDLWMRFAARGTVSILAKPLVQYRLHPHQMSAAVVPWAPYVKIIRRRQRELGDSLGLTASRIALGRTRWIFALTVRYVLVRLRILGRM